MGEQEVQENYNEQYEFLMKMQNEMQQVREQSQRILEENAKLVDKN